MDHLTEVLAQDRNDEEIVGYALETLANICSSELFDEEDDESLSDGGKTAEQKAISSSAQNVGEQFTEIFLKVWIFQFKIYFIGSANFPLFMFFCYT